jgi:streptomycin 6-kinase
MRDDPEAGPWLADLPAVVDACTEQWGLTLGEPYLDGMRVSYVRRAERADGTPVARKVQWPHRECEHEADALRTWAGDGAVRLLEHDRERHALLLERAEPGTHLAACAPEVEVGVIIDLMQELAVPVTEPAFTALEDEASYWADEIPRWWEATGRPFERRLVDAAVDLIGDLAPTQGPQVLLHQDLHGENVLAAERAPWLAIDPKPLVGELAFAPAPVVRSHELGFSREEVHGRVDRCSEALDVDRDRVRGWAVAQMVAWSFDAEEERPFFAQTARWLIE